MKRLALALCGFMFAGMAFAEPIVLDKKRVKFEGSDQKEYELFNDSFEVVRTHKTPLRAHVKVRFSFEGEYCAYSRTYRDPYSTYTVCNKHDWKVMHTIQTFVLHFRNAKILKEGETETYRIHLEQENYRDSQLKISGEAISNPGQYKIRKSSSFRFHSGLKFYFNS